jgi:HEAT repeat protein
MARVTNGPPNRPEKEAVFVSRRSRQLAQEILDGLMKDHRGMMDALPGILHEVATHAADSVPAIAEAFRAEDPHRRVIAASLVWTTAHVSPDNVLPQLRASAEQIVTDAIIGEDHSLRVRACVFLMNAGAPEAAIPTLRRLLRHSNAVLAATAAAVLFRTHSDDLGALRFLHETISSDIDLAAGIAAGALLRPGVHEEFAIPKVVEVLPRLGTEGQFHILNTLKYLSSDISPFFDVTSRLLNDENVSAAIRGQAAAVIGRMGREPTRSIPLLLRAAGNPKPEVVAGAIEGLERSGDGSPETVSAFAKLLFHRNEIVRGNAANGLRALGSRAAPAIPALIQCLETETALGVCDLVMQALGATGSAAIPSLSGFIRRPVSLKHEAAIKALALTGDEGVEALATLAMEADDGLSASIALVLGTLGRRAEAAVPVFARMLDQADDNLSFYIVWYLYMCGPWAVRAVPALIRCICERGSTQDEIGAWAERVLFGLREQAIPALQTAMEDASENVRARIERTLAAFTGWKQETLTPLADIDLKLVRRFVAVGDVLAKERNATSWPDISEILLKDKQNKSERRGLKPRSLATNIGKLGKQLGDTLTTHGNQRKGTLTPEGRRWLEKARNYLREKDAARRLPEAP